MRKCINCSWQGEIVVGPLLHCPICGDNTKDIILVEVKKPELIVEKPVEVKKPEFDLDGDGDVDKDDRTKAGKLLGSKKGMKR